MNDNLCNQCGETRTIFSFPYQKDNPESYPAYGLKTWVIGEYESYYLLDGNKYIFTLCEKCLRKMFMSFTIPPKLEDRDHIEYQITWEEDQHQFEWREWQKAGGEHINYLAGLCNRSQDCSNLAIYSMFIDDEFTENTCCETCKTKRTHYYNTIFKPFINNIQKTFL